MSPLGETLRRARQARGITLEDAERVTRIPRKYLEALEIENFGILPAPVYARGFLRSYSTYLGLDPKELLPFFPVGHVEEPKLDPLPEVREPRTWNPSTVLPLAVVAGLVVLVFALYSFGREDTSPSFLAETQPGQAAQDPAVVPPVEPGAGEGAELEDLAGQSLQTAVQVIEETGAEWLLVGVNEGDLPANTVVDTSPPPGAIVGPGDTVTIFYSR
jgi:cytoskeletal protein RodZ